MVSKKDIKALIEAIKTDEEVHRHLDETSKNRILAMIHYYTGAK